MSAEFVRQLCIEQRRRLVGNLMDHAERHLYPKLSPAEQRAYRDKVLQAVGSYHDVVLDMLKAAGPQPDVLVNEEALRLLRTIHSNTRSERPA